MASTSSTITKIAFNNIFHPTNEDDSAVNTLMTTVSSPKSSLKITITDLRYALNCLKGSCMLWHVALLTFHSDVSSSELLAIAISSHIQDALNLIRDKFFTDSSTTNFDAGDALNGDPTLESFMETIALFEMNVCSFTNTKGFAFLHALDDDSVGTSGQGSYDHTSLSRSEQFFHARLQLSYYFYGVLVIITYINANVTTSDDLTTLEDDASFKAAITQDLILLYQEFGHFQVLSGIKDDETNRFLLSLDALISLRNRVHKFYFNLMSNHVNKETNHFSIDLLRKQFHPTIREIIHHIRDANLTIKDDIERSPNLKSIRHLLPSHDTDTNPQSYLSNHLDIICGENLLWSWLTEISEMSPSSVQSFQSNVVMTWKQRTNQACGTVLEWEASKVVIKDLREKVKVLQSDLNLKYDELKATKRRIDELSTELQTKVSNMSPDEEKKLRDEVKVGVPS
jgi:hypothetical protein